MQSPNLVILYVKNPIESAAFYERIFGQKPVSAFPSYAAFTFPTGLTLGLWSTQAPNFVSSGTGNRSELAFWVSNAQEVRDLREAWGKLGLVIEQELHEAVFGLTFVALDLDGHRIRTCPRQTGP